MRLILTKRSCFFPPLLSSIYSKIFSSTDCILPITYWVSSCYEFHTDKHLSFSLPFHSLSFPSFTPLSFFDLSIIHCLSYPISIRFLGSESPCHQDPFHNILCQVYGTKHVLLFPPGQHVRMHGCS